MSDHIAIITVVYKNYTVLEDFLKSLQKQKKQNFHLYIADASPEKKEILTSIPHTLIPIENKGYAYGINVGINKAISDGLTKFCVINDDTFFKENFTLEIEHSLQKHPNSLIAGKIYYAPGHEYHTTRYSDEDKGNVIWYAGGIVDWAHALTYHRGVDEVDLGQYNTQEPTEFITGCLVCFDKKVIDTIGFWDEDYFLYYEDSDYCERAKKAKLPLIYNPSIIIWHKNAQSTEGAGSSLHEKYQKKSRLRFAIRYAPLRTTLHLIKNYFFQQ